MKNKNLTVPATLAMLVVMMTFPHVANATSSSASYQESGGQLVPAVNNSNSSSYKALNVLTQILSANMSSSTYTASVGPAPWYPSLSSSTPGSGGGVVTSSSGGGVTSAVPLGALKPIVPAATPGETTNSPTVSTTATISNVQVIRVGKSTSTISFDVSLPRLAAIFYTEVGTSEEKSTNVSSRLSRSHTITIAGLKESTTYSFRIFVSDSQNTNQVFSHPDYVFRTLKANQVITTTPRALEPGTPTEAPREIQEVLPQPRDFYALTNSNKTVDLTWKNPENLKDVGEIELVRQYGRFPLDPGDGEVIYRGNAEKFTDRPSGDLRAMYGLFTVSSAGEVGIGSYASAQPQEEVKTSAPAQGRPLPQQPQFLLPWWVYLLGGLIIVYLLLRWIAAAKRRKKRKKDRG